MEMHLIRRAHRQTARADPFWERLSVNGPPNGILATKDRRCFHRGICERIQHPITFLKRNSTESHAPARAYWDKKIHRMITANQPTMVVPGCRKANMAARTKSTQKVL